MADGRYLFQVTAEYEEERIDKYISLLIDSLSRSFIQKLLRDGQVLVNGKPVKQNYRLNEGDEVSFFLPEAVEPDILPENIPLDILYEDEDVLVVNKPKGMVVHPAAGHYSHTLVNALMYHCRDSLSGINGVMRPGIVHRIDRDTTGSLLVCKNDAAHLSIAAQLKEHSIVRRYRAVVYGVIDQEEGVVNLSVGRDPSDRKRMAAGVRNGKEAVTHYRVLQRFHGYGHIHGYTYIECRLETGRTHQIRVHMEAIGHPLLGDEVYRRNLPGSGKPPCQLQGQCLHAMILGFHHPRTGEYIETTAPLPDYFSRLLHIFGG